MITAESLPGLRRLSPAHRHIFGNGRLSDLDPELQKFTMDARGAPQPVGQAHLPYQVRISTGTFGRPARERDFQRQYRRKPDRCQRTTVSGWMIVMAFNTDGNSR